MAASRAIALLVSLLAAASLAAAQATQPAPGAAAPQPPSPAASAAQPAPSAPAGAPNAQPAANAQGSDPAGAPAAAEAYSYDPAGRRDPFVSLLVRGGERSGPEVRPAGREGLLISEVTLRGIVKSQSAYMAMLQGADNKTYIVRAGDKMLDGVVKVITADAVVFAQDVNDPLSLVKQREIRKSLRVTEEEK